MNKETIFHVIKDPVHGTMQFTATENNWIKPFIDSPNFQRLRHIKQLGMTDYIFPGAVHTRFNHCLGCSYVASQICDKIGLPDEERQLVMIACLLHDIGHGPFSHTFEDLFQERAIRHEDWTPYFLQDYKTDAFFDYYNHHNPKHPLNNEKFKLIEDMIMHKSPVKRLLADIVSSQLDADRLDYLLRDSHFCGVTYGEFDFRWMLNSMVKVPTDQGPRLGLTHKGIGVIEHYVMARRLMMRNIYFHQKKLTFEFFLIKLLANLAESLSDYAPFTHIKTTRLGHFLLQVNAFNHALSPKSDNADLQKAFFENNYASYKELADYDIFAVLKTLAGMDHDHPAIHLAKRLQTRQMPKIVRLDQIELTTALTILNTFKASPAFVFSDWQLAIIKSPHQSYAVSEDPILIMNEDGFVRPINEISLMMDAIGDKLEQTAFLCIDQTIVNDPHVQTLIKTLKAEIKKDYLSTSSMA